MGGRKSDDYKGRHLLSQDGGGCHVRCGKMSLGKRISNQISVPKRSSILAREIPRTEEPGSPWDLQVHGVAKESDTT